MKGQLLVHLATCFLPFSLYLICIAEYLSLLICKALKVPSLTPNVQTELVFLGGLGFLLECEHAFAFIKKIKIHFKSHFPVPPNTYIHLIVLSNN